MATVVYWDGTREELDRKLASLGDVISGRSEDDTGLSRAIGTVIGVSFLHSTAADFQVKMRHGTGEVGGKWQELKADTIARRKVPAKVKGQKESETMEAYRAAKAYENQVYKQTLANLPDSMSRTEKTARARQAAFRETKKAKGKTARQLLGMRDVEILKDTGLLLNSLSPGFISDGEYHPGSLPGSNLQIFRITPGRSIVGTNRLGAETHQYGSNDYRNIPIRKFFPYDQNEVPESWWKLMRENVNLALPELLTKYFKND